MDEKASSLKKEVWSHFKNMSVVFLATNDGNQPKVRPVVLIHFNDRFWVTTGTNDAKVKQIRENEQIEFCLLFKEDEKEGYVRGTSTATIVQDKDTKKLLADNVSFFDTYWKDAEDPNYTLLEIVIKGIEYLRPGVMEVERFSLP